MKADGPGAAGLPPVLAIVGPTASGKSSLGIEVARRLDGEIISMDSRQVYRGMDIGTAKVSLADRARAPHHGLDLLDPDERYSAGRFARDARRWIRDIRGRGRVPILVGGTGFFLKALTDPIFQEPDMDRGRRDALREWLGGRRVEDLAAWVRVLDPVRARVAEEGGAHRLIRTLEIALLSGRPLSWWHEEGEPEAEPLQAWTVVLELPREELDRRIDARAEHMMERGLEREVRQLLDAGFRPGDPGMTGTGYREVAELLRGERTPEEAREAMALRTRQYARRQLTWFRNQLPDAPRLDALGPTAELADAVVRGWRESHTAGEAGTAEAGTG